MPQASCRNPSAQKSAHADRIGLPASRALVDRSVIQTSVRTTVQRQDEIGTTAWKTEKWNKESTRRCHKEKRR
jgi:hypothetical protein